MAHRTDETPAGTSEFSYTHFGTLPTRAQALPAQDLGTRDSERNSMRLRHLIGLMLLLCWGSMAVAQTRVAECRGAHGERMFGDPARCAASVLREWTLPAAPASPPPARGQAEAVRRQRGSGRSTAHTDVRESYQCTTPSRSWYQHTPCRGGSGSGKQRESVRQTRVSRAHACREIARPAALLRRGSQQDQRAGPYEKATGRDPCR